MTQTSFVPTTIENCKSMQFKITGTAEADFELEDITVVYRRKELDSEQTIKERTCFKRTT